MEPKGTGEQEEEGEEQGWTRGIGETAGTAGTADTGEQREQG